jgi:hypothetical protein
MHFAPQFGRMQQVGLTRPTPTFGTPGFTWSVGLLPKQPWHELREILEFDRAQNGLASNDRFYEAREKYVRRRKAFVANLNNLLKKLQGAGSWNTNHVSFTWDSNGLGYPKEWGKEPWFDPNSKLWFPQLEEDTLAFTLSWVPGKQHAAGTLKEVDVAGKSCGRLRVHAEMHPEHVTLAFYLEFEGPVRDVSSPKFIADVLDAVDHFTNTAKNRLKDGSVNKIAQGEPTRDDTKYANCIYDCVWSQLFKDFQIDIDAELERAGLIFSSYRGFVLSAEGYGVNTDARIEDAGSVRSDEFELEPPGNQNGHVWETESLAVTKAHWPLISCLGEIPDQREFIASKVYGRRAIFVSPLGSVVQKADAPGKYIDPDQHVRFAIIASGRINRESCGRLVERLMSILILKAMATRDFAILNDASEHSIVRGQELDAIVDYWIETKTRLSIELLEAEKDLNPRRSKERDAVEQDASIRRQSWFKRGRTWKQKEAAWKEIWKREDHITELSFQLAQHMIRSDILLSELAKEVGKIGFHTTGGLAYRLFKSQHYAKECLRLVGTVDMEPMYGWASLAQNFQRGVEPVFEALALVRERVESLRRRIQLVTEMVQTGAIFEQQRKTSENTDEIRKQTRRSEHVLLEIEQSGRWRMYAGIVGVISSVASAAHGVVLAKTNPGAATTSGLAALIGIAIFLWAISSR